MYTVSQQLPWSCYRCGRTDLTGLSPPVSPDLWSVWGWGSAGRGETASRDRKPAVDATASKTGLEDTRPTNTQCMVYMYFTASRIFLFTTLYFGTLSPTKSTWSCSSFIQNSHVSLVTYMCNWIQNTGIYMYVLILNLLLLPSGSILATNPLHNYYIIMKWN